MSKLIATHSGTFHADDVFGVTVLAIVFAEHRIIRSRQPEQLAPADFLVDVGGVWDAAKGRFDHHQRGFDGARTRTGDDGGEVRAEGYASAGLVWREWGPDCVQAVARTQGHAVDAATAQRIAADIDDSLVRYLDLVDTGAADVAPGAFGLSSQVAILNSTWLEEHALDGDALAALQLQRFHEAMALVRRGLERLVLRGIGQELAAAKVRAAERHLDGRVLLLAEGGMPWTRIVVEEMPEVLFVVYPEMGGGQYQIRAVPAEVRSFRNRHDLPAAWAGRLEHELASITGVPDAVFCHSNRFIAGARSLPGALAMARLALAPA